MVEVKKSKTTTIEGKSRCWDLTLFYRKHTADENVLEEMKEDLFFSGVPEYHLHRDDIIIDVGAHIGTFSLLVASRAVNGKVFAIEASKESFDYLCKNSRINNFRNVSLCHLALAGRKGETRLYHDSNGNWGHTIMKDLLGEYELAPTDSLENFMADNDIEKCDFMKINCEGAEFDILLNAPRETLKKIRTLLVLYHLDLAVGYDELTLPRWLNQSGFTTTIRSKTAERGWIIAHNNAFKMRMDELFRYSLWQVCNRRGGRSAWQIFSILTIAPNKIAFLNEKIAKIRKIVRTAI